MGFDEIGFRHEGFHFIPHHDPIQIVNIFYQGDRFRHLVLFALEIGPYTIP
jgi:hypothetical protein